VAAFKYSFVMVRKNARKGRQHASGTPSKLGVVWEYVPDRSDEDALARAYEMIFRHRPAPRQKGNRRARG